jgi:hypothetical protein
VGQSLLGFRVWTKDGRQEDSNSNETSTARNVCQHNMTSMTQSRELADAVARGSTRQRAEAAHKAAAG